MLSPANYKFIQHMLVDTVLFIRSDNSEVGLEDICKCLDQEVKNIRNGNIEYVLELRRSEEELTEELEEDATD